MKIGKLKVLMAFIWASSAMAAFDEPCVEDAPCVGGPAVSTAPAELSSSRVQVVVERYPSGQVMAERRTFDGVLDGVTKEYYKNGQVMNEWAYRMGELHGESRSFYRNGDLKTVWKYKHGKLNGETRHYHERKILEAVEIYKDGALVSRSEEQEGLPLDEAR
jgi:hypothetical protein